MKLSISSPRRAMLLAVAASFATGAEAALVHIDFEMSAFTATFNGVAQSTGPIQMRVLVDTTTANLGSGFGNFNNFYAAQVFFTAPALGLFNTQVVTPTYLYFGNSVVGFTSEVGSFNTIFTSYNSAGPDTSLSFTTLNDLSTLVVPQAPITQNGTEFRTIGSAIVFANGSFFDSGVIENFGPQTNTVSVSPVPESSSMMILGLFGTLLFSRRSRR